MKINRVMTFQQRFAEIMLLVIWLSIHGCTKVESDKPPATLPIAGQPGAAALTKIEEQNLVSVEEITALVERMAATKKYRQQLKPLPESAYQPAAELLNELRQRTALSYSVETLIARSPEKTKGYVKAGLVLFPVERYALYRHLKTLADINLSSLDSWASQTDLYIPQATTAPSASHPEKDIAVVPLIESANITVFNQNENVKAAVEYRETKDDPCWHSARHLSWEPVQGVLTGPIVFLNANTAYDLKITLTDANQATQVIESRFTTRPDKPPIDPNKIYQLSEIYAGGTLNLEELNIEGNEDGWAKIVGDPTIVIEAEEGSKNAIYIGDNSYVYFENITVRGGRTHAIYAEHAHHIWINQCDIAKWGRHPNIIKNGKAYELPDAQPINYDSALYFKRSGVITIENCHVHDPNPFANDWSDGHPNGANAFLAYANHPDPAFKGQIILRNNVFTGTAEHRFNDVIEGRKNAESLGGFVRDSAIYNNTLAYANDDAIEIDGGQHNVLVYNNDISHTYSGISAAPARIGPSFIFNNYIHDLGDQRGKQWAAIKVGGLITKPLGQVNLFHNLITIARNGITASRFQEDDTFWIHSQNNVIVTEKNANKVGFNVYDPKQFSGNQYINDYLYNLKMGGPKVEGDITLPYRFGNKLNQNDAMQIFESKNASVTLPKCNKYEVDNFTQLSDDKAEFVYGIIPVTDNTRSQ
ncbi:right-handed parallel beta-helix repeat-containing protein [Alteromonas sp. ASW11-130]|uniref:right-handed parallel beta-helix repeat-containing protein n=1 Tax=Alteromonas sp. ASW11-130 TaxID=3015775 RepID=UPI0022425AAC|nr:right-handed parallel beta-helix repeat-containing protein [Alteromonas sp. ASW11-130]MCW8090394.1 right-handed parallel beta-helix repeat-containing protein [Alteromonas sp. ASW11-130]